MTEADWLAATDPMPMLAFLEGKASDRKLRLFAVACCRRIPIIDSHDHGVAALDLAERLAEGRATNAERRQMRVSLMNPRPWIAVLLDILSGSASTAASRTCQAVSVVQALSEGALGRASGRRTSGNPAWRRAVNNELAALTAPLRDIIGNPFRPVAVDPSWGTFTVVALARQMYESRDFTPMSILADALQDAGCDHLDILDHCRGPGPHVRGCWVVDLLLGKE
jgi:hypothetical protein